MRVYQLARRLAARHDVTMLSYVDGDQLAHGSRSCGAPSPSRWSSGAPGRRLRSARRSCCRSSVVRHTSAASCTRRTCRGRSTGYARSGPSMSSSSSRASCARSRCPGRPAADPRRAQPRVGGARALRRARALAPAQGVRRDRVGPPAPLRADVVAPRRRLRRHLAARGAPRPAPRARHADRRRAERRRPRSLPARREPGPAGHGRSSTAGSTTARTSTRRTGSSTTSGRACCDCGPEARLAIVGRGDPRDLQRLARPSRRGHRRGPRGAALPRRRPPSSSSRSAWAAERA